MIPLNLEDAYSRKKVLITGGMGFLGSNLAHRLVELGANVSILDAQLPLYGGNPFNLNGIENDVDVHIGDIRDENMVSEVVVGKDIIFNFAAQVSYIDSNLDPLLDNDINCRGHIILLESCKKSNPDARMLFSSSRMVYGRITGTPVPETHTTEPLSMYGTHKLSGENYHLMYYRSYKVPTTCLRIANPYGPRQQMKHSKYSILGWFIRMAMEGQTIKVFGEGEQIRDYIYVSDIVEGFLACGVSDECIGEVFNIGSGTGSRFVDMIKTILEVVDNGEMEHVPWPEDYESVETGGYISDNTKLTNTTGWKSKVDLRKGIELTFDYYNEHRDKYWN